MHLTHIMVLRRSKKRDPSQAKQECTRKSSPSNQKAQEYSVRNNASPSNSSDAVANRALASTADGNDLKPRKAIDIFNSLAIEAGDCSGAEDDEDFHECERKFSTSASESSGSSSR